MCSVIDKAYHGKAFLETNEYLNRAYDKEFEGGKDALYQYIQQ